MDINIVYCYTALL